jgi:hypothetical protein
MVYIPEGRSPEISELPFKIPGIWAEDNTLGVAQNVPPVVVELRPGAIPVSQKQYFIFCKVQVRIKKYLEVS